MNPRIGKFTRGRAVLGYIRWGKVGRLAMRSGYEEWLLGQKLQLCIRCPRGVIFHGLNPAIIVIGDVAICISDAHKAGGRYQCTACVATNKTSIFCGCEVVRIKGESLFL